MAKYKTLPNYEVIRPGLNIRFNREGIFETTDAELIAYLDDKAPSIARLDKPEVKPEVKPEPKAEVKPEAPKKHVAKPKSK